MRVLFTAVPAHGHLLPLLPLARAARTAGADVVVSAHEALAGVVGDLPFTPSGPSLPALVAENARRNAGAGPADLADTGPIVDMFTGTRVEMSFDALLDVARTCAPDLVVADSTDFVAPLVAAALGVPRVAFSVTTALDPLLEKGFEEGLADRLRERGLPEVPRRALVDAWPAWLQPDGYVQPADVLPIRPEAHDEPAATGHGARFPGREHLPTVLLTLGTVVGDRDLHLAALEGVLRRDVNVLLTAPAGTAPAELDVPADRVHVTGFTPLARLLPGVSAVVAAGGAGTVLGALTHGVPLVLMPVLADQPLIAERVAASGAAVACARPEDLGEGVGLVLGENSYRDAARRQAACLAQVPSPAEVWRRLGGS
ncbi:glycosyltransferase [Kineococcus sp. NUM-3379]